MQFSLETVARIYAGGWGPGFAAGGRSPVPWLDRRYTLDGGSDHHRFECLILPDGIRSHIRPASLYSQRASIQVGFRGTKIGSASWFSTTNKMRERAMKFRTIALATVFALSSTFALAQGSAGGSSQSGSPTAGPTTSGGTSGGGMSKSTTGMGSSSTAPSAGDASNSGAPTAAGPNSQGTRTEPGAVQGGANGR
jgi:hypothetical protein